MGKPATRSIEDTLADLDIDKDLEPGEAAAEAAEETASSSAVEEALADTPPLKPKAVEEESDDDDNDVEVIIPLPAASASAAPPEEEQVLVPAPRAPRAKPRKAPPGAAKIGKGLADKVPGSEKVKVYKVIEGRRHFINDYTKEDLSQFSDFESFLTRYVKPEHGSGEYDLVGVDARNNEMELGQIRLIGTKKTQDNSAMAVVQQMLAQQQQRDADWLKRMENMNQPQPQQNPLDLLTGVMTLQEKLTGKADAAKEAAAAEKSGGVNAMVDMMQSSGDKSMQMMMMMMQQQQQASDRQMQMMMALMSKPKEEDPVMKIFMMKFMEDGGSSGGAPLPPPPPPPKESTSDLITALATFMAATGKGNDGGSDDFKDFLKEQHTAQLSNNMSTKDVLELVQQVQAQTGGGPTPGESIKDAADNLALVMNIANNVNRQNEGGPAAGLFDALAALFSNRDFAGSMAQAIRSKTGGGQGTPATPEQQLQRQQQLIGQRVQQLAAQQRAGAPGAVPPAPGAIPGPPPAAAQPPGYPPGYPPTAVPLVQAVPGGPPVAAAPLTTPQTQQTQQTQQAAETTIAKTNRLPELPKNTYEHINNLANAPDEAALVGGTVTMLIYFAGFDLWRDFSETVLGLARSGNKQGTLEYLKAFFDGMAEISMIDETLAKKVLAAIDAHFDTMIEQLSDLPLEGDQDLTGADLTGDDDPGEGDDEPHDDGREEPEEPTL